MMTYIVISLLNGICISLSRSINGRLSIQKNALYASVWNHIIGFIFLTSIILIQGKGLSLFQFNAPFYAYLGGIMGALFVAINSYVLPKIGSTQATILIISGQMITSVIIDQIISPSSTILIKLIAIGLIIFGILILKNISISEDNSPKN